MIRPRLADVQCSRLRFMPGDRIIVRSRVVLDKEDQTKLKKTVERWAGDGVEVLVVCLPEYDVVTPVHQDLF